jgi:DNA-binding response OmpR family regulator
MMTPTLRILVAEDDRGIQTFLRTVLTREGFSVECANDGAEAIGLLRAGDFDAVLLDLTMPHVSGGDVIQFLDASHDPALSRVIVVTAASMRAAAVHHRLPILRKPFDLTELLQTVRSVAAQLPIACASA